MNICLLLNDPMLRKWQATALEELLEANDVSLSTIIYNETPRSRTIAEVAKRALELGLWSVIGTMSQFSNRSNRWTEYVPLETVVDRSTVTELSTKPVPVDGWKQHLPAEPVQRAASQSDLAIRFGFGFIVGPVLSAFEHGVLSYHHGDIREYRGQPMGFWEFYNDEKVAGITVQRLTDELDAGEIAALKRVPIDDCNTWQSVRQRLFAHSEDMLETAVENVREGGLRVPDELGEIHTHPRGMTAIKFVAKTTRGHLRNLLGGTSSGSSKNVRR